jgi:hypothetical protein
LAIAAAAVLSTSASVMAVRQAALDGPVRAFAQESVAEPIPLTPLTDVSSLEATVTITADGLLEGKPTQGELTAELTSTDQGASRIDVTGSLLGPVVAQVGGKAVSLFRPDMVSIYSVPEGTYVVVSSLFDVCVKPEDSQATEILGQLSPETLMTTLTNSDVAIGTRLADETLNGMAVTHYSIDGAGFLEAAQGSSDANVRTFAGLLESATDADIYLSAEDGYPVSYRGGFGGDFEALAFSGDFGLQIDLTAINGDAEVTLPGSCDRPISVG